MPHKYDFPTDVCITLQTDSHHHHNQRCVSKWVSVLTIKVELHGDVPSDTAVISSSTVERSIVGHLK